MDFTIESQQVVKYGDQTWTPAQITVDEVIYFQFCKWDRAFVKWVTGKSLDLRKDKSAGSADCEYMDQVLSRRQAACDDALHAALHDEGDQGKAKKRRKRASASDGHLVHRVLNMTCLRFLRRTWQKSWCGSSLMGRARPTSTWRCTKTSCITSRRASTIRAELPVIVERRLRLQSRRSMGKKKFPCSLAQHDIYINI